MASNNEPVTVTESRVEAARGGIYEAIKRAALDDEAGDREIAAAFDSALAEFEQAVSEKARDELRAAVIAFFGQPPVNWTTDPTDGDIFCFSCDDLLVYCKCPADTLRRLVGLHPHGTLLAASPTEEGNRG